LLADRPKDAFLVLASTTITLFPPLLFSLLVDWHDLHAGAQVQSAVLLRMLRGAGGRGGGGGSGGGGGGGGGEAKALEKFRSAPVLTGSTRSLRSVSASSLESIRTTGSIGN